MGNKTLVYRQKVTDNLSESYKHLFRVENAFDALKEKYSFPITINDFQHIIASTEYLAYSDQIIYRFSKLQDCMGAKPFLDILNQLEVIDIINVDEWFEIRDLRNEIAHDYGDNDTTAINILNIIHKLKNDLKETLDAIERLVG